MYVASEASARVHREEAKLIQQRYDRLVRATCDALVDLRPRLSQDDAQDVGYAISACRKDDERLWKLTKAYLDKHEITFEDLVLQL